MKRLWLPLVVIGWVFVAVGCGSLGRAVMAFIRDMSDASAGHAVVDALIVATSGAIAVVGGAFMLRARAWARWVCTAWMGAHVVISILHTLEDVLMHVAIFTVILVLLWHSRASASLGVRGRE